MKIERFRLVFVFFIVSIVSVASMTSIYALNDVPDAPTWIKDIVKSWSEDQVSNEDFVDAVLYMINNDILKIPELETLISENQQLKHEINLIQNTLSVYEEKLQIDRQKLVMTVHTNKNLYGPEDDIIIFGTVSDIVEDHDVGIVISNSLGKVLAIAKIPPNEDKSYGFVAKDSIFRQSGEYFVHVYYGGVAYDHTNYSYRPLINLK